MNKCCFLDGDVRCKEDAEWELQPSNVVYEFVQSCTKHVGYLLDDAPETRIIFIGERTPIGEAQP